MQRLATVLKPEPIGEIPKQVRLLPDPLTQTVIVSPASVRTEPAMGTEANSTNGGCSAVGPVAVAVMAAGPVSNTKGRAMTVDELEALIKKAETVLGTTVAIGKYHKGSWWATNGSTANGVDSVTHPEVIAKLHEWATPPRPETLTIAVPFEWVQSRADGGNFKAGISEKIDNICREALKPWSQS